MKRQGQGGKEGRKRKAEEWEQCGCPLGAVPVGCIKSVLLDLERILKLKFVFKCDVHFY